GDRVGLVVFSGEGATQSPLTSDYPVFLGLIDKVDHGKLPEGTAIGMGLATSINLLRDSRSNTKVVILLTDGENNAGEIDPVEAARMAQLLGMRVYTIGVGGGGSSFQRNRLFAGEATLRAISETTGAAFFRATDPNSLKDIYDVIGKLEKSKVSEIRYTRVDDLWLPFLAAGFCLLILEITLSNTVFRRFP
ncbi:MAG: VWA domain-containing protein, partial [Dehalococcoidia bacterium]|nr:VWA domain-containing protein [Dehalococcoidia bacterium]